MSDSPYENSNMNQYFSSLPLFVQESIMQIGLDIKTEEELRNFADKLMNKQ